MSSPLSVIRSHATLVSTPPGSWGYQRIRHEIQQAYCTGPESPCYSCSACEQIIKQQHPDVLYATDTSIDGIRGYMQQLQYGSRTAQASYFIIPDAHSLSTGAANALLKFLEAPPEGVRIVLTAYNTAQVPSTIRSRCHTVFLQPCTTEILQLLRQKPDTSIAYAYQDTWDATASFTPLSVICTQSLRENLALSERYTTQHALYQTVQWLQEGLDMAGRPDMMASALAVCTAILDTSMRLQDGSAKLQLDALMLYINHRR